MYLAPKQSQRPRISSYLYQNTSIKPISWSKYELGSFHTKTFNPVTADIDSEDLTILWGYNRPNLLQCDRLRTCDEYKCPFIQRAATKFRDWGPVLCFLVCRFLYNIFVGCHFWQFADKLLVVPLELLKIDSYVNG